MSRKDLFLDVSGSGCYEYSMQDGAVITKDLRLNRRDIAYVKHIFEGYEGLVTVTTVDRSEAVVRLCIMPGFASDVAGILEALREEIDMFEIGGGERR